MQTLTDIKAMLASRGLRPKHRFGQNFLHDQNQVRRIVEVAAIEPGDVVLEVGPGTGALSEALLEAGARLTAIEVDGDLEPILHERFAPFGDRARLILGDVLRSKHALAAPVQALAAAGPFKLIANLPYHVASPLLVGLTCDVPTMTLAIVMVQREVADRLTAPPGGKAYGPLGILVQATAQVKRLFHLPPSCFWPQPQVDSAVVRLVRRSRPIPDDLSRFSALVHRLFQQRRKQIGTTLGRATALPPDIRPDQRPEQLSVEQLAALSRWLAGQAQA